MAGVNNSTNEALYILQCPLIYPITWHSYFSSKFGIASSVLAIIINLMTMPLIVLSNLLILVLVVKVPSLRKERLVVLACLSLADLLTGMVSQPLFVASEIHHLYNTEPNCILDSAFYASALVFSGASFHHLVLVAYDRYTGIIKPFKYSSRITIRRLLCTSITIWIINVAYLMSTSLLGLLPLSTLRLYVDLIFYGLGVFAMVTFLIFCYIKIFSVIHRQQKRVNATVIINTNQPETQQNTDAQNARASNSSQNSAWTAMLLLCSFCLTSIPLMVCAFAMFFLGSNIRSSLFFAFLPLVITFFFCNSLLNPIIYYLRTEEIRYHLRRLLKKHENNENQFEMN